MKPRTFFSAAPVARFFMRATLLVACLFSAAAAAKESSYQSLSFQDAAGTKGFPAGIGFHPLWLGGLDLSGDEPEAARRSGGALFSGPHPSVGLLLAEHRRSPFAPFDGALGRGYRGAAPALASPIPEPASYFLLIAGLVLVVAMARSPRSAFRSRRRVGVGHRLPV